MMSKYGSTLEFLVYSSSHDTLLILWPFMIKMLDVFTTSVEFLNKQKCRK